MAREVKNIILAADEVFQTALVPDVAEVDRDAILDGLDVDQVPAVVVDHGVEQRHPRAQPDERDGEVAAEEAQPAGDQDLLAAEAIEGGLLSHWRTPADHWLGP